MLDGDIIAPADGEAMTMRRRIARDGLVVVVLDGNRTPAIEAIGLPLDEDMAGFVAEAAQDVRSAVGALRGGQARDPATVQETARLAARRAAQRWSGKRPQVRVIMLESAM